MLGSSPALMMFKRPLADATMCAITELGACTVVPKDERHAETLLPEIEVFVGAIPPAWLARASKLRWVQATSGGLDGFFYPELRESPVVITNVRGLYGDLIADHVMAFMLSFSRGMHRYLRRQWERRWDPAAARPGLLAGAIAGIIGLGSIRMEVAQRARAFGMRVRALDPAPKARPDYLQVLHPPGELKEFLEGLDYLVIAAPLTSETQGMIDATALKSLKPSAILINVGRSRIVDVAALKSALREQRSRGGGARCFRC
jgi:phosphoglycerate dehydrogenase-like enzyme